MINTLFKPSLLILLAATLLVGCPLKDKEEREKEDEAARQHVEENESVGDGLIKLPQGAIPEEEFPVSIYAAYKNQFGAPLDVVYSTQDGDYSYTLTAPMSEAALPFENAYLVFMSKSGRYGRFVNIPFDNVEGALLDTEISQEVFLRDLGQVNIDFRVAEHFAEQWQYAEFTPFMNAVHYGDYSANRPELIYGGMSKMSATDAFPASVIQPETGIVALPIPTGQAESDGESIYNANHVRVRLYGHEINGVVPLLREKWVEVIWPSDKQRAQVNYNPLWLGVDSPEQPNIDIGFSTVGENNDNIVFTNHGRFEVARDIEYELASMLGQQDAIHLRPNFNDNYRLSINGVDAMSGETIVIALDSSAQQNRVIEIQYHSYQQSDIHPFPRDRFLPVTKDIVLFPENTNDLHSTFANYTLTPTSGQGDVITGRLLDNIETVNIPHDQAEYLLTISPDAPNATVTIDGENLFEKVIATSASIDLAITVTAENTVSSFSNTLSLIKGVGDSAEISELYFAQFNLSPAFDPSITEYSASYTYVHTADRAYIPLDSMVSMTAIPAAVGSRFSTVLSGGIVAGQTDLNDTVHMQNVLLQLPTGDSTAAITVHSEDGTVQKTYTINIQHQVQYPNTDGPS